MFNQGNHLVSLKTFVVFHLKVAHLEGAKQQKSECLPIKFILSIMNDKSILARVSGFVNKGL
jgi:hypothetical protein